MKTDRLIRVAISLMLVVLAGCPKSTISTVKPGYQGVTYADPGGTMKWYSWNGTEFTIQFQGGHDPCDYKNRKSNLTGTKDQPAICYVLPDTNGNYHYKVLPKVPAGATTTGSVMLAARVGPCNNCSPGKGGQNKPPKQGPPPQSSSASAPVTGQAASAPMSTTSPDYPPYIDLDCVGGNGTADPNPAYAQSNDQIFWQVDGSDSVPFKVTIDSGVCSNGVTTISSPDVFCAVTKSFDYHFTVGNCNTPTKGTITIQP